MGGTATMQRDRLKLSRSLSMTLMFAALGLSPACVGPSLIHESRPNQLRREIASDVADLSLRTVVIPHEVSEQTLRVIDARVSELDRGSRGARGLLKVLFGPEYLNLGYEWAVTLDAESTIAAGAGNCVSLSAVLVGTARAYGGAARYVEVRSNPERHDYGDLKVWSSHVAVLLPSREGPLIVDFLDLVDPTKLRYRVLSDRSLVAHYYNDLGYELIHRARSEGRETPWDQARQQFEIATQIDEGLSRAWNNLGVTLTRLGNLDAAEAAYRRALTGRHEFVGEATVLNLASLENRRELEQAPPASPTTPESEMQQTMP
jgi:tetratricopeptide (TPR) repeat protein